MATSSALLKASFQVPRPPADGRVVGELEVYSSDPACTIAVTGRYVLMVVKERVTNTALSSVRRAMIAQCELYPVFGFLVILEPRCQLLLPSDVRTALASIIKRHSSQCAGAAIVYEQTGFHATAVRSVVTAINFASRATHPTRVCAELTDGVSWLNQLTGGTPTTTRLLLIAKQLRVAS